MGWLKKALKDGNLLNRTGSNPAYFNYLEWGNKICDPGEKLWEKNIRENIAHWDKNPNDFVGKLKDLPHHENDCLIFVGASPILKHSVKYLKNLDPRFKIIVANSSLKYLLDHGVIPHYCIMVDGNPGRWTFEWEQIRKKCKDVIGLFGIAAYPPEIRNWPGKYIVIPYRYQFGALKRMIKRRYGNDSPLGGGNALNCAIGVFLQFSKATMFLFVGNELSFKGSYYVNKGKALSDGKPFIFLTNIYGKEVRSLLPLYEYKIWLENIILTYSPIIYFCNCSEGVLGVDSDGSLISGLDHKPLPEAIEHIKKAWKYESKDLATKTKEFYNILYEECGYEPTFSEKFYTQMVNEKNLQVFSRNKKILDFGCGLGRGVMVGRNAGLNMYGVDIADNQEIWMKNGVSEYCISYDGIKTLYKDNEFDLVSCYEVMEHIAIENTESTLREILRIGKSFIFTIALNKEKAPICGNIFSHINIRSSKEWIEIFERIGFKIQLAKEKIFDSSKPESIESHLVINCYKDIPNMIIDITWSPSGDKVVPMNKLEQWGIL